MITMAFLRSWFRWLLGTLAALVGEWVLLTNRWWFAAAAVATLGVFAGITAALYGDWKAARQSGARYDYTMVDNVSRDRDGW